jgi:addiction module HigA family antidote
MTRIPTSRAPIHPGEILLEEFLKPANITQVELAEAIDVSVQRVNEIVKGRRDITPSTALRLSRFFGTTPDVWLNLQLRLDLWKAMQKEGREVARIQPRRAAATG